MSKNLYVLENIKSLASYKDNLCWAACLQMVFELNNNSKKIEEFQLNAVKKYKETECYSQLNLNEQSNNILMRENCIDNVFKLYNIDLTKKHSDINNFDFYIKHLNEKGLPLLLGINTGQGIAKYGHLVLVCGYGFCENNKYLLTFDPDQKVFQKFWKFENNSYLYRNYESIRLWSINLIEGNSQSYLKKIEENFISDFFKNINKELKNVKKFDILFESKSVEKIEKGYNTCNTSFFYTSNEDVAFIKRKIKKIKKNKAYYNDNLEIGVDSNLDSMFIKNNSKSLIIEKNKKMDKNKIQKTIIFNN